MGNEESLAAMRVRSPTREVGIEERKPTTLGAPGKAEYSIHIHTQHASPGTNLYTGKPARRGGAVYSIHIYTQHASLGAD